MVRRRYDALSASLRADSPISRGELDRGARGAGESKPAPNTISVASWARRRAVLALPATLNGESMDLDIVVRADTHDDMHVDVHLIPSGVGAAIVQAPLLVQALLAASLTDALDVTVDVP